MINTACKKQLDVRGRTLEPNLDHLDIFSTAQTICQSEMIAICCKLLRFSLYERGIHPII